LPGLIVPQIVGAFINAFAQNLGMYIAGRAILGGAGGFAKVAAVTLIQEVAHPRLRPLCAAIYYSIYYTGSITAAWLCFGTLHMANTDWSWRLPSLFQIFGPILVLALTCTMPESPRWMVKNGKGDMAFATLAKYHA
jgi:MFS family permease